MSFVAIKSGELPYDGELVTITAGRDYVMDGHELVLRFPHMWKKAPSSRPRRRGNEVRRAPHLPTSKAASRKPAWHLETPSRPVVDEYAWKRTARHEAAHAAAAHLLGWEVTGIDLHPTGGGGTDVLAPVGCKGERRASELAVIAAVAEKYVGWTYGPSYGGDRKMVAEARSFAPDPLAQAAYDRDLKRYVAVLVGSPRFRRIASRVAEAVLENGGKLGNHELAPLLTTR